MTGAIAGARARTPGPPQAFPITTGTKRGDRLEPLSGSLWLTLAGLTHSLSRDVWRLAVRARGGGLSRIEIWHPACLER